MTTSDSLPPGAHDAHTKVHLGKNPRQLSAMCDSELVVWQSSCAHGSPQFLMAEREWQRRLIIEQIKSVKWAAVATGIFTIAGAVVGAVLTYYFTQQPNSNPSRNSAAEIAKMNKEQPNVTTKNLPSPALHVPPLNDQPNVSNKHEGGK